MAYVPYCTLEDLRSRTTDRELIDLTGDGFGGEIAVPVVDAQIVKATAAVESFLRGVFPVPVAETVDAVPPDLRRLCADIAVYFLYSRQLQSAIPEPIADIYRNARKELTEYQTGKRSIDDRDAGNELVTPVLFRARGSTRVFPEDLMGRF